MIQFKVSVQNNITPVLQKMQRKLDQLPQEAEKVFVQNTPVRTGNARRNTKRNKDTIVANYPYAKRLDEGYSKQRPEGMTKPTEDFIIKRFNEIMSGK